MKHTKIFFALLVLAGAILAFGCNQANSNGGNNSGSSGSFTMNPQQKMAYDAAITQVKQSAAVREIPANMVELQLQGMNQSFANLGFKIVDTQAGQPIAKGTDENALKARFKAEAVSGGNNGGNNGGSSGSFTMNPQQKMAYDAAIDAVKQNAAVQAIPANIVELQLQGMNQSFASLGFKIVDTQAGQPIAQGTTEEALKARFKAEAL